MGKKIGMHRKIIQVASRFYLADQLYAEKVPGAHYLRRINKWACLIIIILINNSGWIIDPFARTLGGRGGFNF